MRVKKIFCAAVFLVCGLRLFAAPEAKRMALIAVAAGNYETAQTVVTFLAENRELKEAFDLIPLTSSNPQYPQNTRISSSADIMPLAKQTGAELVLAVQLRDYRRGKLLLIQVIDAKSACIIAGAYDTYGTIRDVIANRDSLNTLAAKMAPSLTKKHKSEPIWIEPFSLSDVEISADDAQALREILIIEIVNSARFRIVPAFKKDEKDAYKHTLRTTRTNLEGEGLFTAGLWDVKSQKLVKAFSVNYHSLDEEGPDMWTSVSQ